MRRSFSQNLHTEVINSSSELFADGHDKASVSEALNSIEVRVRTLTGPAQSSVKLMGETSGGSEPRVSVATSADQSGKDEKEGFATLFRGARHGVRNPRAHDLLRLQDPVLALSTSASPVCFIVNTTAWK